MVWHCAIRYEKRSDPMPDESVNFWIFYHLNIKTVAEFGWWPNGGCYCKMVCSVFNIHFGEIALIPSAYFWTMLGAHGNNNPIQLNAMLYTAVAHWFYAPIRSIIWKNYLHFTECKKCYDTKFLWKIKRKIQRNHLQTDFSFKSVQIV